MHAYIIYMLCIYRSLFIYMYVYNYIYVYIQFFFTQKGYYSILLFYPLYLRKFWHHPRRTYTIFKEECIALYCTLGNQSSLDGYFAYFHFFSLTHSVLVPSLVSVSLWAGASICARPAFRSRGAYLRGVPCVRQGRRCAPHCGPLTASLPPSKSPLS